MKEEKRVRYAPSEGDWISSVVEDNYVAMVITNITNPSSPTQDVVIELTPHFLDEILGVVSSLCTMKQATNWEGRDASGIVHEINKYISAREKVVKATREDMERFITIGTGEQTYHPIDKF